jgi:hypothetical protein
VTSGTSYAITTSAAAGNVGFGTTAPARSLDVNGTWGGNVVVDNQVLTATATVTEATKALAYHLTQNTGTTNATVVLTFNITGLPAVDGTIAYIATQAQKGLTTLVQRTTVNIQINGTQISTVQTANGTPASTVLENFIVIRTNGTYRLAVGTTAANTADLAEWIPYDGDVAPSSGDVVSIAQHSPIAVAQSASAYDKSIIGVVATEPHTVMGHYTSHSTKLALAGRVPVNVSTENGPIAIGDMLTSSSIPGVAMRATKAGPVIGKAMEAFDGEGVGSVTVLVGTSWYGGTVLADALNNIPYDGSAAADSRVLAYLATQKEKASRGPWSDLVADRVIANQTLISPRGIFMDMHAKNVIADVISISSADATSKNISYDSAVGLSGDMMRTDASGWAASAHGYADMFASNDALEAGDLVMVDTSDTSKMARATKDSAHTDFLLAGVVASRPGFIAGMNEAGSYPIAIQGRVAVKVTGPVAIGDPITVSDTPGVGAKATDPTYIVGIALQAKSGDEAGVITVFVRPGWYNGSTVQAQNSAVSGVTPGTLSVGDIALDLASRTVLNVGAMQGIDGLWNIDGNGKLTAKEVSAEKISVTQTDTSSTLETGTMLSGETATQVHNPSVTSTTRIFVTFRKDPGSSWWVDEIGDGFFVLKVRQPVVEDVPFDYWIVGVNDMRSSPKAPAPTSSTDSGATSTPAADSTPSTPSAGGSSAPTDAGSVAPDAAATAGGTTDTPAVTDTATPTDTSAGAPVDASSAPAPDTQTTPTP